MFEGVRSAWTDARIGGIANQARDLLGYYEMQSPPTRWLMFAAFDNACEAMQEVAGSLSSIDPDKCRQFAKELLAGSRDLAESKGDGVAAISNRLSAKGGLLAALYIELHSFHRERAMDAINSIAAWRSRASEEYRS